METIPFKPGRFTPRPPGRDAEQNRQKLERLRTRTDRPMSPRWHAILTLDLRGFSAVEISERLRCSSNRISLIRGCARYKAERDRRLGRLDDDFVAMKPLAFDALRRGLRAADENVALRASEQWFKTAGFGRSPGSETPLTAEAIAAALLSQQINVTVNVDGRREEASISTHSAVERAPLSRPEDEDLF